MGHTSMYNARTSPLGNTLSVHAKYVPCNQHVGFLMFWASVLGYGGFGYIGPLELFGWAVEIFFGSLGRRPMKGIGHNLENLAIFGLWMIILDFRLLEN